MEIEEERKRSPALIIEYTDAQEGFKGWLVIDALDHDLCAGGIRVQQGLTCERLVKMARNMTCKMRICGLRVDGAKSGIDYDPAAPGKRAAISRFMAAIAPYVRSRYSMGPDMNVTMAEIESIGRDLGFPSVKMAVAAAQGWEIPYFSKRYQILNREIDGWSFGKVRVGYGVSVATLTVLDYLGIPGDQATVAIQGFGNLARAAAFGLVRKGVRIMALADAEKCLVAENRQGLDVRQLLESPGPLLPDTCYGDRVRVAARDEIFTLPVDILIPGAVEESVTGKNAGQLQVRAVVPGANLAITPDAEQLLFQRGVLVVPDFLAGCGGSLFMEGLFAPKDHPYPDEIIAHVEQRMEQLIRHILEMSRRENITPTAAARRACAEIVAQPGTRPYGDPH